MERPVESVLVAADTGGITANTTTLAAFLASGTVGELAIFNADTNTAVAGAALPTRHYYAVKVSTTELRKSPTFNSAPAYIASAVGASGSAGSATISSFDGDCETEYIIKVRLESEKIFQSYGYQDLVKTYSYVSRCCGSACGCPEGAAWDVAMGIAEQINADRENEMLTPDANEFLLGNAIVRNSDYIAGITVTNFDNDQNWDFVQGSADVTCTTNIQYGGGTAVVVGDFIAVIDTGAVGTVSDANADYFRVEAINGLVLTLDRPYPHGTFTAAGGGSDLVVVPKATAEAIADSKWSIEIPGGQHATPAVGAISPIANVVNSQFVSVNIGLLGGFDCNGTVSTTAPTMPNGQDWQVSQMELKNSKNAIGAGNRPSPYRTPFPLSQNVANESLTVSGMTYYVLSVSYADQHTSAATAGAVRSPYVVRLVIADTDAVGGTPTSTTYDNVVTVFGNGWNGISINSDGVIPVL